MSQGYSFEYSVSPDLLRRAMTSWARPADRAKKQRLYVILFVVACVSVGLGIGMSGVLDRLSGDMLTGLLIGFYAGLGLSVLAGWLTRRKLSGMAQSQLKKQGPTQGTFDARGVRMNSNLGDALIGWAAFDQVILMTDASALRLGAVIYPIPHSALPSGVDAGQFHSDLITWQEAAQ